MKQTMKHLVSFIALIAMMVSLCSAMVFPAAAAEVDEYETLLNTAFVVNPAWSGLKEGTPISFDFRGETIEDVYDQDFYFSSFKAAWDHAQGLNLSNPVILLTAGEYADEIELTGGMTLLGPNAGVNPNVASTDKKAPWTKAARGAEAVLKCAIIVKQKAITANVTFDGLTFGEGSGYVDNLRNQGASELTVKNTVFETEGNKKSLYNVFYMRNAGHARTLRVENVYVTGYGNTLADATPANSFIAPYFSELYVENLAYVENPIGFLAKTWFANGVAPVIEINNSCFYNADPETPKGYVLSIDNAATHHEFVASTTGDVNITNADGRPNSLLQVSNSVFYNASAAGVVHYELINKNSVIDMQNNYVYSDNLTTLVTPEYLVDSVANDQTSCFIFRKNVLLNSYLIPTVQGAGNDTYIDMSQNFFGTTEGECVYNPVYVDSENGRLIRTEFYVTPDLTQTNLSCQLTVGNWPLVWVDNQNFKIDILAYESKDIPFAPTFSFGDQYEAKLYQDAKVNQYGVVSGLTGEIDKINLSDLKVSANNTAKVFLNAEPKDAKNTYTPSYTINIEVIGDITTCKTFAEAYPGYYMYHPLANEQEAGSMMPFRWDGSIYRLTVGENLFGNVPDIIAHANAKGVEIPTIVVPAGTYDDELTITGSCTILGAQHGVNPNVKPYDVLSQDVVDNSQWTLNPARGNDATESTFNACIRVAPEADDYVITVDGIKMGEGCSYVDDVSRNASNVTILKNILADGAGGGFDRSGNANAYVFNFNKEYGMGTEYTTLYMYDIRVVNVKIAVTGPLIEKMVADGVYVGGNTKQVWNAYRSRDVDNALHSWTNSYFAPHGSGASGCHFSTNHHSNSGWANMKNIVYFWDGNVFYNAFPSGNYINCYFTGDNMTVYVTNNTVVSDHADTFFGSTASLRTQGNCKTVDTSNMIVMKGNHMINYAALTRTYGTAPGTMWDFSGNYYADNTGATIGFNEKEAYKIIHNADGYTLEEASRCKIDYTFLDWEMTQRSDAETVMNAEYTITKDPAKFVNGVYTDNIAGDVAEYPRPYELGEYSKETIYLDAKKTVTADSLDVVAAMKASGNAENVKFYVDVTSLNGKNTESFVISLNRTLNNKAEVVSYANGLVGNGKIDVVSSLLLYYYPAFAHGTDSALSLNATAEYFADEELTQPIEDLDAPIFMRGPVTAYLRVTSEDGNTMKIYKINLDYVKDDAAIALVGVLSIDGMTQTAENAFEATVSAAEKSVTIRPNAFRGTELKLTDASGKMIIPVGGEYGLDLTKGNTFTLVATSGNGENAVSYTLTFKTGKSSDASIISVEGARKSKTAYILPIGLQTAGAINVKVAPGATYDVYYDYACTKKCENGLYVVENNESGNAYVKVISEDGTATSRAKVVVLTQAGNVNETVITGTVGEKTYEAISSGTNVYTMYLPASVKSVVLKGKVKTSSEETNATFFSDPNFTNMISMAQDETTKVNLEQKKTVVYVVAPATTRDGVDKDGNPAQVSVPERRSTLYIYSDRDTVTYTDAAKIADWAKPYVDYLNNGKFGIMQGDEKGNFNATKQITRYEIAAMACRVFGLDVSAFSGVSLSYADSVAKWAQPYVKAVTSAGLMNGSMDAKTGMISFEGAKGATREQVMKILVTICLKSEGITQTGEVYYTEHAGEIDQLYLAPNGQGFADEKKVSSWAKPYVRMAVGKYQMINGELKNGQYYLNPKSNITRAEVTKMVACYLGYGE